MASHCCIIDRKKERKRKGKNDNPHTDRRHRERESERMERVMRREDSSLLFLSLSHHGDDQFLSIEAVWGGVSSRQSPPRFFLVNHQLGIIVIMMIICGRILLSYPIRSWSIPILHPLKRWISLSQWLLTWAVISRLSSNSLFRCFCLILTVNHVSHDHQLIVTINYH